jgi:hypothetical protein
LRLKLEDQGDGWFWDVPSIEVEVVAQAQVHSRLFYRVGFADPGAATGPGAWLSSRWVGHEIRRDEAVSALLWLVAGELELDRPPRDVPHSARVGCREVGE